MDLQTLSSFGDFGYFSSPPPESPQIDFSEITSFAAPAPEAEAEAPEDGRRPSVTDADTPGVNADDQHVDVDVDAGADHREKIMKITQRRILDSFKGAVEQDLKKFKKLPLGSYLTYFLLYCSMSMSCGGSSCCDLVHRGRVQWCGFPPPEEHGDDDVISMETPCSVVRFNPDDSRDSRKTTSTRQGCCWKEKSMAGMRAAAEPSSSQLLPGVGQQGYVGLKKTLELHGGGKWRAHEYTPLLPSEDGTKLVPAEISLRVVFKDDDDNPSSSSSKRPRTTDDGLKKNGPKKSHVWEHMTKVHVKAATTPTTNDLRRRRTNPYRVIYAICNHCDKVFKADPKNGTSTPSNHLDSCSCNCPRSRSRARDLSTPWWYKEEEEGSASGSSTGHATRRKEQAIEVDEAMEAGPPWGPSHRRPNVRMSGEEWAYD